MVEPDVPYDSPMRTHTKRGLPASFASTYPYGHISGHPRMAAQQKAFLQTKTKFLRQLSSEQIEAQYWETVAKINAILEEDQKRREEIDREMDKLKAQRELERRIFWKQKEEKELREKSKREASTATGTRRNTPAPPPAATGPAAAAVTTAAASPAPAQAPKAEPNSVPAEAPSAEPEKTAPEQPAEVKQETET